MQDHAQDQRRLQHGELASDAGALAGPERFVGVRRPVLLGLGDEVGRVERLRVIAPDLQVAVQHRRQLHQRVLFADLVLPAQHRLLVGVPREGGGGGPEAQRLLEHLRDVPEVIHPGVGRRRRALCNGVHAALQLRHFGAVR